VGWKGRGARDQSRNRECSRWRRGLVCPCIQPSTHAAIDKRGAARRSRSARASAARANQRRSGRRAAPQPAAASQWAHLVENARARLRLGVRHSALLYLRGLDAATGGGGRVSCGADRSSSRESRRARAARRTAPAAPPARARVAEIAQCKDDESSKQMARGRRTGEGIRERKTRPRRQRSPHARAPPSLGAVGQKPPRSRSSASFFSLLSRTLHLPSAHSPRDSGP
jgi:hypothetical protein